MKNNLELTKNKNWKINILYHENIIFSTNFDMWREDISNFDFREIAWAFKLEVKTSNEVERYWKHATSNTYSPIWFLKYKNKEIRERVYFCWGYYEDCMASNTEENFIKRDKWVKKEITNWLEFQLEGNNSMYR